MHDLYTNNIVIQRCFPSRGRRGVRDEMGNVGSVHDLSAIDRRINYLQQELYTYDKFLRNPQAPGANDMGAQAKFAIDAQGNQEELEQLMYLRSLATAMNKPTTIKTWQVALMAFYSTIAVLIAVLSLWLASASH